MRRWQWLLPYGLASGLLVACTPFAYDGHVNSGHPLVYTSPASFESRSQTVVSYESAIQELDCALAFLDVHSFMKEEAEFQGAEKFMMEARLAVGSASYVFWRNGDSQPNALKKAEQLLEERSAQKPRRTYDEPADQGVVIACTSGNKPLARRSRVEMMARARALESIN